MAERFEATSCEEDEHYQQVLGEAETEVRAFCTGADPEFIRGVINRRSYSPGETSKKPFCFESSMETTMSQHILKDSSVAELIKRVNPAVEEKGEKLKQSLHKAKAQIHDAIVLDGSVRNTKFTRDMRTLVSQTPDTLGFGKDAAAMLAPLMAQFPILAEMDIYELVKSVVTEVANGLEAPTMDSAPPQGGNNDSFRIDVDPNIDPEDRPMVVSKVRVTRGLVTMSVLTMGTDIGMMFHMPPKGTIFDHNKGIYYLTLGGIFAAGVGEAWTARWLARSNQTDMRRFCFGRKVLLASLLPLASTLGMAAWAITGN